MADAASLAILAERSFRDTFSAENTPADIDSYCAAHFGEHIQRDELCDPNRLTFVARSAGELVAYAQVRLYSAQKLVQAKAPAELVRLYVAKAWHGRGVAHELMSVLFGLQELRAAQILWLGVWEHNPRAIAFYQKYDFQMLGTHIFQLGSDAQTDWIMARDLGRQPPT